MKAIKILPLAFLFLSFSLLRAQDTPTYKFNLISQGGIGYGLMENDSEPNYNLNSNYGEVLLNYRISKKIGLATGFGLNQLSGNGFNTEGNFFHERMLIKIPLVATIDRRISEKISFLANFGVYTQHIIKDEYRFLSTTREDVYAGWNFGAQFGISLVFDIQDDLKAGINYHAQSDFSNFKTKNNQTLTDQQKFTGLNGIGFIIVFEL